MKIIQRPSPNYNQRAPGSTIDLIVVHYTDMLSAEDALHRLCDPQSEVSAHYLISKSGEIYQMVNDEHRAWHAGVSSWQGETDVNSRSIGIELDYPGHTNGLVPYPEAQINALLTLCKHLQETYNIHKTQIIGHEDVAPGRKVDPGPFFPWDHFRNQL